MSRIDMTEELVLMRDISEGLARVAGTMRILMAVRLLESGEASTWIEAVRMARRPSDERVPERRTS